MANELKSLYTILPKEAVQYPPVDTWVIQPEDMIFKQSKGAIQLPVAEHYGIVNNPLFDQFSLIAKRCYNTDEMRDHMVKYINYFEKYYDVDHELVAVYFKIKYLIDYEEIYNADALMYDIKRYILDSRIGLLVRIMNEKSYTLDLSYKNNKNPGLQYTNKHGLMLMEFSLFQNMMIPILTHFAYVKNIKDTKLFLLTAYQMIMDLFQSADIENKLFETTLSTVTKNVNAHQILWNMQGIRAKNALTHSDQTVQNILLQIAPKYTYDKNIIHFNYKSILKSNAYQVTDIGYEFKLKSLSSSKRDEENNSEFDKYDAHLIKHDEALYIQNKVNSEYTMENIERLYGPFDPEEILFYKRELMSGGKNIIIEFQKKLIFNVFYKYFGDTKSINSINADDYVKLIIAAKKLLLTNNMKVLPYIISGKIVRLVKRVAINKKELTKIEASPYYETLINKYKNPDIIQYIYGIIATILSSKFQFIDKQSEDEYKQKLQNATIQYNGIIPPEISQEIERNNINGKIIDVLPEFIVEEVIMYVLLI